MPHLAIGVGGLALVAWLYLAFFHGWFWKPLLDQRAPEPAAWPSVDIVIPARNEAETIPLTLPSLLAQDYPGSWKILLVDDHSNDGTADIARQHATSDRLTVVVPPPLPEGWSGKVAAMNAGVAHSTAAFVLFTDADIEHPANSLRRLVSRAIEKNLDLTSRMVRLHCESLAEKLLVPAFVFFFAMLYPFRRANDPSSGVAAAAGGVMLVRRQALDAIGGLARIKSALIDDCALARAIKDHGAKVELTLADDVRSLRRYPKLEDLHAMVARTAYTQLRYSPLLLAGTCLGMTMLFLAPPLLLLSGNAFAVIAALVMFSVYLPTVRFYKLPALWALSLPVAAALYVFATLDSARLHWQGRGGQWKGRKRDI